MGGEIGRNSAGGQWRTLLHVDWRESYALIQFYDLIYLGKANPSRKT
jgi:hypothetical protein